MNRLIALALTLLVLCAAGCNGKPQPPAPTPGGGGGHGAHQPPPGWCGVAVGDHFAHLAVKSDPATGQLDVVIYDGHFEHPVRVKDAAVTIRITLPPGEFVDVQCDAVADQLSGETVGDSATFRGRNDVLKGKTEFTAVFLGATIKGQAMGEVEFPYPKGKSLH
ncbi:MAG: hypothetical protein ACYTGX_04755 [Planctomycetota bacterium]|jgi:hypothetical protein